MPRLSPVPSRPSLGLMIARSCLLLAPTAWAGDPGSIRFNTEFEGESLGMVQRLGEGTYRCRVRIVAVCDVNRESAGYWDGKVGGREPARRLTEGHYAKDKPSGTYRDCDSVVDYREILGRDDIDAVEVCTPDPWHAIPVIEACKAKKDIDCQKPLALTIAEGRAMSFAGARRDVVFQTGSQQRSDPDFRRACDLARNGRIGKLRKLLVGLPGGRPDFAKTRDRKDPQPVPEGFDYVRWLGPAPAAP